LKVLRFKIIEPSQGRWRKSAALFPSVPKSPVECRWWVAVKGLERGRSDRAVWCGLDDSRHVASNPMTQTD
jgi:hypothetical protein